MHKIQKISKICKCMFLGIMGLLPLLTLSYWSTGNYIGLYIPHSWTQILNENGFLFSQTSDLFTFSSLSSSQRCLAFLVELIPLSFQLLFFYFLTKLFQLYENLHIFTEKNVKLFRNLGYTLLISQIIHPLYESLFSLVVTFSNPPGERVVNITFSGENFSWLCGGILLILISWIMEEGKKLQEEQEHTV